MEHLRGLQESPVDAPPSPPPPPPPPAAAPARGQEGQKKTDRANSPSKSPMRRENGNGRPIGTRGGQESVLLKELAQDLAFAIPFEHVDAGRLNGVLDKARQVAGRAAAAVTNPPLGSLQYSATYQAVKEGVDRNKALAEMELRARATAFALRLLLGQIQVLGETETRKAMLVLGAETVARSAEKGVLTDTEYMVSLTDQNVVSLSSKISRVLVNTTPAASTSSTRVDAGPEEAWDKKTGPAGLRINVDNLGASSARSGFQMSYSSLLSDRGAIKGRLAPREPRQERGRARFRRSKFIPAAHQASKLSSSKIFKPEVAWASQLRSSKSNAENQTGAGNRRSMSPGSRSQRSRQVASPLSLAASWVSDQQEGAQRTMALSGRIVQNPDLEAQVVVSSLLKRSSLASPTTSTYSAPSRANRSGTPKRRSRSNPKKLEAEARRRRAKEYGNFYSEEYGRERKARSFSSNGARRSPKHL